MDRYEFDSWTINGSTPVTSQSGIMTSDTTFTAHFKVPDYEVTFSVKDNIGGTVNLDKSAVLYGTEYQVNENNELVFNNSLKVTPTPDLSNHYHFVKWTVDESTDVVESGTVTANLDFYA